MEQRKFLDFLDMIDGGGAGQRGDKFEGGGLLSSLANALATPYGSEDAGRMAARDKFYASQNIGQPMNTTASMAPPAASMATTGASLANMPSPDNFYNNPNQTRAVPDTFYNNPQTRAVPDNFYNNPNMARAVPDNFYNNPNMGAPASANMPNPYMQQSPELTFQQFVAGLGPEAATASPHDLQTAYHLHMTGYAQ